MPSKQITVKRILRPLRSVLLARPDDEAAVRRAIEINTCLWGGLFNAIVLTFGKTIEKCASEHREEMIGGNFGRQGPNSQEAASLRSGSVPAPSEIVRGYLDAFEPDNVVEMDAGLCG
jgi:hypothetical protein